mgnify:CR=1 FL=1
MTDNNEIKPTHALSLKEVGPKLEAYAATDPRFKFPSDAARHLIKVGMESTKEIRARAKALEKYT